ncbi:PadR family transcriptional regulator [Paenibacillus sp. L3-i20]|uniref:PadR family transcriptional regulator n=1 Tax=Paenibacillus sp. L3-i20 TaxID=2905833 RepID=UPI001EDD6041|nr:PadR family transcriptional regulator [Paenibacillus sp. L3-i20]GKU76453.1 PadR family transcriptional regulator [Paenibacillus sp. L3-i20]
MNSQDVILGILMKRSLTGYEIKGLFEDVFSFFYSSSFGTIYPVLNRMEKENLIKKEVVIQSGKPNKNIFTITQYGKERFNNYLNSPLEADEGTKSDFLMRLYFGHFVSYDLVVGWLKQTEEHIQFKLDALRERYSINKDTMQPPHIICMEIGIKGYSAKLEAIREGLVRLERLVQEEREQNDGSTFE